MSLDATRPHDLPLLPPSTIELDDYTKGWLLRAHTLLAELKGYSVALPNPLLLLSPAILKEAIASSEIENINTTMERVLQQQLFPEAEQKTENKEVLRYKEAVIYGFDHMGKLSLSNRLIREIHKVLLGDRSYGYRKFQNHIENSQKEIIYTPPVSTEIETLIANWEKYVHEGKNIRKEFIDINDPLIKCAIAHYQFEAIHPFNDGNGRTGRILMVLFLVYTGILHFPILYISGFINEHRSQYYKLLQNITTENDWLPFINYMLMAFSYQAIETKEQLFKLMSTFYETKESIKKACRNIYDADLVEILFSTPIITPVKLGTLMGVHYTTATRYLKELTDKSFLEHKRVGKYQLYMNAKLIKVLEGENNKEEK